MSIQPVRFGLVGAGAISHSYAQAFETCKIAQVVGVADTNSQAASALADKLKCPSYTSYTELAKDASLEAVLICTPPNTHPEICLEFLGKGVPVLCEKPLSIDVAGGLQIIQAARKTGVKLTMASKFRFVEDITRAKNLVASGVLGEIVMVENFFTSHVDMRNRWNSNPAVSGGGVLIDNGTHSVDLIRYFTGPLKEIHVVEGKRSQNLPVEETVHIFVRSESGVLGTVDLSWDINKELESYLRIYGSEGTISVGWKESKFLLSGGKEWKIFGKGYNKVQAFRSQIENFAKALRGEEMLLLTLDDALASVQVVEAAYASLRDSRWISIPLDARNKQEASLASATGVAHRY